MKQLRQWTGRWLIGTGEFIALASRVAAAFLGILAWWYFCWTYDFFRHSGIYLAVGLDGYGLTGAVLEWLFLPGSMLLMLIAAFAKMKYTRLLVLIIAGYMLTGLAADALLRMAAGRRLVTIAVPQSISPQMLPHLDFPVWSRVGKGTEVIFRRSGDAALDQVRQAKLETGLRTGGK